MTRMMRMPKAVRATTEAGHRGRRRASVEMRCLPAIAVVCLAIGTRAPAQTVVISLDSPQAGTFVQAGATIQWTISAGVSSGDNQGLAFVCADLVQGETNPATLDVPHADGVPAEMTHFSSPAGVSNPPDVGMTTGYVGTQVGDAGAMNLVQIGGGQNLFGHALPAATGFAQSDSAVTGVGQNGGVILASGSFAAPAVDGPYAFELQNVLANVLSESHQPPLFSLAVAANVDLSAASFTFSVGDFCDAYDADCDGSVSGRDIQPFMTAVLTGVPSGCSPCAGDADANGTVNAQDIQAFVAHLLAS